MSRTRSLNRIIAIAGPKGGIGRSTCAAVLARALAAREREVLIVDLNPYGCLAPLLDLSLPSPQVENSPVKTSQSGLSYLRPNPDTPDAFIAQLHNLAQFDDIVLDLNAGFAPSDIGLFIRADIPVLIADPEPAAVLEATLFLRLAILEHIRRFEETSELSQILDQQSSRWDFNRLNPALTPSQQNQLIMELRAFKCAFLLNNRRENSESLQSRALCHAWGMKLGINVRFLGSIPFDDRRWFFDRKLADVSTFTHEDPLVHEMDTIVRENLNSISFESDICLPLIQPESQPRDFLQADSPQESRKMYRILWEGYRRENGLVANILSHEDIVHIISQLEHAYRKADAEPAVTEPVNTSGSEYSTVSRSFSNTFAAISIHSDKCQKDAGFWIKKQRENAGLSLSQLSLKSRIPAKILEKIEDQDLASVPSARLHAYLFEVSKALELDFEEVKSKFGLQQ